MPSSGKVVLERYSGGSTVLNDDIHLSSPSWGDSVPTVYQSRSLYSVSLSEVPYVKT